MSDAPNRCIFCGDLAALTNEHIWGEWVKNYVRLTKNNYSAVLIPSNRPGEHGTPIRFQRAGDPLMAQLRVVCGKCNSGFLSQIQNRAQPYLIPLFEGTPSNMDDAAQAIISSWVAMAVMTASYTYPDRVAIPQSDRNWLMHTLTAPKGWKIWIGHCDEWGSENHWARFTLPILDAEHFPETVTDEHRRPNTQSTAFKIGRLYAVAMSSVISRTFDRWAWSTYPRAIWMLQQAWPIRRPFEWPFARMSSEDAEGIATAFMRFTDKLALTNGYR